MSSGAEGQAGPDPRIVFVVHGRNIAVRNAMFQFLRAIGLRPREWSQAVEDTGKASPYIGEVLEAAFSRAQAVVVLMTPDDEARLRAPYHSEQDPPYEKDLTPQARPNVLFEAGMAMGRAPDRTVLVEVGNVRPFSDIAGRHVVRLNNSSERRQELAQRLSRAGCDVDLAGIDWHREGDFSVETAGLAETIDEQIRERAARKSGQQDNSAGGNYSSMVLMLPPGEAPLFVESLRIESGEIIKMTLSLGDNRQAAILDSLSRTSSRNPLPVAFGSKAMYGRVSDVKHVLEGGREVWNVELVPEDIGHNWEMNYSGFPAEQVAEMRARRILINEKLSDAGGRYRNPNDLNAMLLEKTVAGGGKTFEVPHSPFPALYKVAKSDIGEFLAAARLFAVLELLLTGTVERIHTLELTMQEDDKLAVRFEGQRQNEYSNRPPHIIKIEGVCDLISN
jgi:predicted nucleotide-binding protein